MASRLFTILFFTFLVTPTFAGTPTKRQATISGTPIQSNPLGIPTLAYNCAKLPSICQNINRRNPIANNGQGVLLNIPYLELHYDTNPQRIDDRRNAACPKTWKSSHACPESNQPLVVRDGDSLDVGISGQLLNPGSGSYQISDPSGAFLGLIWTCNDWPPAMS
jgi:hypothetical protein